MAITEFLLKSVAQKQLSKLSQDLQRRITTKFKTIIENKLESRHLRLGMPYFVEEIGQIRVIYEIKDKQGIVLFIADHKEYEKELRKK